MITKIRLVEEQDPDLEKHLPPFLVAVRHQMNTATIDQPDVWIRQTSSASLLASGIQKDQVKGEQMRLWSEKLAALFCLCCLFAFFLCFLFVLHVCKFDFGCARDQYEVGFSEKVQNGCAKCREQSETQSKSDAYAVSPCCP